MYAPDARLSLVKTFNKRMNTIAECLSQIIFFLLRPTDMALIEYIFSIYLDQMLFKRTLFIFFTDKTR